MCYSPLMTWTVPDNYSPSIYYDLFPSRVTLPDAFYTKARVIVTHDTLFVFVDSPSGPASTLRVPYSPAHIYGSTKTGLDLYAALDPLNPQIASVVSIRPEAGCGCGTRLKALRPFSTLRHSPPPTSVGPLPAPPTTTTTTTT